MDLIFAAALVILHRIDGAELVVNPAQVTALHPPLTNDQKLLAKQGRCAVWLADGKLLSVLETCDQVRVMLESAKP